MAQDAELILKVLGAAFATLAVVLGAGRMWGGLTASIADMATDVKSHGGKLDALHRRLDEVEAEFRAEARSLAIADARLEERVIAAERQLGMPPPWKRTGAQRTGPQDMFPEGDQG
jgi:outer membrane murein-binding lipoprotein Lpp